jgi:hypothetical protein
MRLSRVVFPAPDGPTTATASPATTRRLTASIAITRVAPLRCSRDADVTSTTMSSTPRLRGDVQIGSRITARAKQVRPGLLVCRVVPAGGAWGDQSDCRHAGGPRCTLRKQRAAGDIPSEMPATPVGVWGLYAVVQ